VRIAFLTHEPFFPPSGGGSAEAVYLVGEFVRRGTASTCSARPSKTPTRSPERFGIRLRLFTGWAMGRYTSLRTAKYLAYPPVLERLVLRVARTERFDVLVSQHAISAVAAGRLRRRLGVPVVMNFLDCLTGFLGTWPPYLMPRPVARALVRYELGIRIGIRPTACSRSRIRSGTGSSPPACRPIVSVRSTTVTMRRGSGGTPPIRRRPGPGGDRHARLVRPPSPRADRPGGGGGGGSATIGVRFDSSGG
jgi:hypothetical protein